MSFISSNVYYITVFFTGLSIMAVEMCAVRLMAPVFGTGMYVWTNVIATIIGALTIGYTLGGFLSEKIPTKNFFYSTILLASIWIFFIPSYGPGLISGFVNKMENSHQVLFYSGLSSLILYFFPTLLLAMATPFAVRLSVKKMDHIGTTAGTIYSFSTIGSLLGTFLPALVTLPLLGTKNSFTLISSLLFGVAFFGFLFASSPKVPPSEAGVGAC